jgi:hypothetical protein
MMNPMYTKSEAGSSPAMDPYPEPDRQILLEPAVTLPDAGNLFSSLRDIVSQSAPVHMQQRASEYKYDDTDFDRPHTTGTISAPMSSV